ncbi:uncharacterized protein [Saccopteryx bilineata]
MDPLPPTLTGCSPWNEADTPRTCNLKYLRAKRVAYFESIGIIKGGASRNDSQQVLTTSQDTKLNPSENQTFGLGGPHISPRSLAIGKEPWLQEVPTVAPGEAERYQDQRNQQEHWTESCPMELDLHLLADTLVPEIQKLRHVIDWAQKFLSNPLQERRLKSPMSSLVLPPSDLCQSSQALGSKRNAHDRPSESPALLREDQSSTQTDSHSCSLSPQNNLSEMALSSEFSCSFQEEGFLDSQCCGWQGTTVRNEGEGRAARCPPDGLQQEELAQQKYNRVEYSCIQTLNENEMFPERLGAQPQLRLASEESNILEEASQSPPRNGYFWTLLTDGSEEECSDEPGESKGILRSGVLGKEWRRLSGITLSPTSECTLVSKTMVPSHVSSPGETLLEAEIRKKFPGAVGSSVVTSQEVTVEFKDDISRGEDPSQRLPVGQLIPPSDSSGRKRKESDNVGFPLWSPQTDIRHKIKWEPAITDSTGKTVLGRAPGDGPDRRVWSSAKSSPAAITQRQFDLPYPENYETPLTASPTLSVSEGPMENAVFHGRSEASVFCGPTVEARGAHSSTWFDQLPPQKMDDGSVQTPRAVTGQTTHEKKEKTLSPNYPTSINISKTGLKGSFPLQNVGDSLSWSDEPPHKPEQEASVLEIYFYYLHLLNKSRGLSSKKKNASLLSRGPTRGPQTTARGPHAAPGGHLSVPRCTSRRGTSFIGGQ